MGKDNKLVRRGLGVIKENRSSFEKSRSENQTHPDKRRGGDGKRRGGGGSRWGEEVVEGWKHNKRENLTMQIENQY